MFHATHVICSNVNRRILTGYLYCFLTPRIFLKSHRFKTFHENHPYRPLCFGNIKAETLQSRRFSVSKKQLMEMLLQTKTTKSIFAIKIFYSGGCKMRCKLKTQKSEFVRSSIVWFLLKQLLLERWFQIERYLKSFVMKQANLSEVFQCC